MGRRARRKIRSLRARRALQCRDARRHHQGRPPRLAIRHAFCRWRARPCRLSAPRRQSGAGHFAINRGDLRRAARPWQRAVPGLQSRIHLGRRRQHRQQRHPGPGPCQIQHPLQRQPYASEPARAGRDAADKGVRQPHPRPHRLGALELQRVRDQAWPIHRPRGLRDRGGDGPQAGAVDLRRHLGRPLHLELLPGDRVRPGRPDHAPGRRACAG